MENPLTPKKIQRLMYLAEDKSFNVPGYSSQFSRATNSAQTQSISHLMPDQSSTAQSQSLSSGVLDLDHCEGFGDSELGNLSLSKSSTFNPGEMTGRSTDTEDVCRVAPAPTFSEFGRYSVNSIESLTKKMNQQSTDVKELMRQSIASTYSFHSRRDLSADEASLVLREAPLPVPQSQINLKDSMMVLDQDQSTRSVGAYFQNRCTEFSQILPRTASPAGDADLAISIMDDSLMQIPEPASSSTQKNYNLDGTLDSVPVRQPKPNMNVTTNIGYTPASPAQVPTAMLPPKSKGIVKPNQSRIMLDPSKQHLYASLRPEETNSSGDCDSLSISNIACILGKESNVSVSDMLKHMKMQKQQEKKKPLTEIDMNSENRRILNNTHVTTLAESKKSETASSAGTINTVIDMSKLKINQQNLQVPSSLSETHFLEEKSLSKSPSEKNRSKSPSTKSTSTYSTVQENYASTTLQSGDSPLHSKGEGKAHVASPNIQYRELDKSVDWHDVLRARAAGSLPPVSDKWAEVAVKPVEGYVGVNSLAVVTVQSLSENWLTARFEFHIPHQYRDLTVDLPRFPILITPGKTEEFTVQLTSNVEMNTTLPYTLHLKDSSIDCDKEMKGDVAVKLRMPALQAVSSGGMNKVVFQPIQEGKSLSKTFVLISDCSVDLQLDLTVLGAMFTINSVQEINKSDVTKKLLDCPQEEKGKKSKGSTKQFCRLSSGNAIKVSVTFTAPKLTEIQLAEKTATFNGSLNVYLMGINALLKKVDLIASVGTATLISQLPTNKLHLNNEVTSIPLSNAGAVRGAWAARLADGAAEPGTFKLYSNMLEIDPGATVLLKITYTGPDNILCESTLVIEDSSGRAHVTLQLTGGQLRPRSFPVKTSCASVSWVRPGRKEISLKNSTDKRIHLKCRIIGDGFSIDLPRFSGLTVLLTFGPLECRPLPVIFSPPTSAPCAGTLHLAYDKETEISRKVCLFGQASGGGGGGGAGAGAGGGALRWRGLVTHGDTALVRAPRRQPVELRLASRQDAPVFMAASVHFNLQYMSVGLTARLASPRRVVPARGLVTLALQLDWALLEKQAREAGASTALATVTVLTGAECTRRRILKVLRESGATQLPEHLRRLAGPFEGEAPDDRALSDFHEPESSLEELVSGLQELSAAVELQEAADEATILIADDTVLDHHTLCE